MWNRIERALPALALVLAGLLIGAAIRPESVGAQSGSTRSGVDHRAQLVFFAIDQIASNGASTPADCTRVSMVPAVAHPRGVAVDGVVVLCERQ
jgi:hypothetical protein